MLVLPPACRSVYRFFFVLYPASVSYDFVLRLLGAFCVPSGFDGWLFRFLRSGSSFASFRLDGGLRDSLFVLRSGWSSVFPLSCSRFVLSARSFALRSPSFPMVPVSPRFSFPFRFVFHPLFFPSFFPMVSVFSLIPFKALLFFVFVPFFRLFALGSASFPFPFSLIRLALPFISFVVFGFLSASLHRDAPSGGGDERAAWLRPTPSASVRPSRRTGRAWSRCRCVACWRRPCPGPGPA